MTLYETTVPYLNLDDDKAGRLLITDSGKPVDIKDDVEVLTHQGFLDFANSASQAPYSAIMISGLFGQKSFNFCNTILEKSLSLLKDNGVLALDIKSIEKMNRNIVKAILQETNTLSENSIISHKAVMEALSENVELLEFKDSRSNTLPDIYVFRLLPFVKPSNLMSGKAGIENKKKQGILGLLRSLSGKSPRHKEAGLTAHELREALSGIYVPINPRVILLSPPLGLTETLADFLKPKTVFVYGASSGEMKKQTSPKVTYKGDWENIISEPNGSAEFIFIGDMPEGLSSSEYLKLIEDITRIRNRGGCVFIKQDVGDPSEATLSLSKTWPLGFVDWAKARNSSVKQNSIIIGRDNYLCVSESSPYGSLIRKDKSAGESSNALQKLKNYISRDYLTAGEASQAVRLFSELDEFYEALFNFSSKFGVVAATRFGLLESKHANSPLIDIVQSLEKLSAGVKKNEAVIFDLVGEFYRLSHEYDMARKYWIKSLFKTQGNAADNEAANILIRKIRLYLPCEIKCETSKIIIADPLIKNVVPKNTVILAESKVGHDIVDSLIDRFAGDIVFTPNFTGDMQENSKASFKPLMGLIAENSDVNKDSHRYAETVSQDIIKALIAGAQGNMKLWLKQYQATIALTIEDFLARHLLIIEAYAKAANLNPEADILLAGAELGYFDSSLNLLLSRLSHDTVWLHSDTPSSSLGAYQTLFENKAAATSMPVVERGALGGDDWFDTVSQIYAANVNDYFSAQNIDAQNSCFVLANLAHRYFGESAVTLAAALHQKGETPIIIDSSTTRKDMTDMSSLWESCHVDRKTQEQVPFLGMLRPKINDKVLIDGLAHAAKQIEGIVETLPLQYRGAPASFAFSRLVGRVLSRDIPVLLYNSLFAEKLISRGGNNHVAALSTREAHDHIFADIFKKRGIPMTMVQCTDILRHPRYKKPVADQLTAIDQTAVETFTDYLGVPKTAINITGSPRAHINFHPERVKAASILLDGRGLALNPSLRVLFATRTGNLERVVECLDKVARYVAQNLGVQLIVKTHPREKPLRLKAYGEILETYNIGGAVNIVDEGAAETLILISDCVISFPSNVVRVAVDIGKPTLIYSPDDTANLEAIETGPPQALVAQTLQEFTPQLEALFIAAQESASSKPTAMETERTLNRICGVIMEQGRSGSAKDKNSRCNSVVAKLYSSLSFRDVSGLIKSQARSSEENSVDIALFERSFTLAGGADHYISILRDLAHYAPPTFEAAKFFAKLSKAAASFDDFNEAIGSLASKKLARYAAQLEYSEDDLAPSTILALAQSCIAAGQFETGLSWYDFGQNQNCKAPLRIRMENERNALSLLKWEDGKGMAADIPPHIKRVIVVAERGTDPQIYTSALADDVELDIYFDGKAGATLGGSTEVKSKSSRDVLHDRAPEIKGIIDHANALAKLMVTQVLNQLKNSHYIGWLKDIRPALEMEIRAGLITQLRRQAALAKAINGPYDAILFACNTSAFLALFSDILSEAKIPTYILGASQSPRRRRSFGAAIRQGLDTAREKQEDILKALKKANTKQALTEFEAIFDAISPRLSAGNDENSVIAITSWRITTIKDACLSLLENFPDDTPITIFDTSRHIADAQRFLGDINNYANHHSQDIRPFSAQYHNLLNPHFKTLKNSALAQSVFASLRGTKEGKALPHALQLGIWNQIGTLLYKTLPMLYDLHIQVSTICAQSNAASLILMPGRDAESITAQNAVQPFGVKTTDVQTAYFSRQYIYTAPRGDIITAMDEWSKDFFVDWFNLPEDKIHILGTSRFDKVSKLRLAQETQPKTAKVRPHICVATQPIQSGLTKEMLTYLNALYANGTDFDCTVKLHPRQSESIIQDIELIAHDLHRAGQLTITKMGDLAQILLSSDLVVTAFSNVAIEAALMDRPVLITNFTGADTPVPFMEFGIAEEAQTQESFETLTKRILYDDAFGKEIRQKRHDYFKRYPSQWRGEAGKDTVALILENMKKL